MASEDVTSTFTLKDGRTLSYQTSAPPSLPSTAPTILYFHGFPGSHPESGLIKAQAMTQKVRLIVLSRPGYAQSTFQPRRTFLDWHQDVLEFVTHIGVTQFYIIGMSGGSPHALACLSAIPRDRLRRVAIVSGAYPSCMTSKETLATNRMLALASTSALLSGLLPSILEWFVGREARDDKQAAKFEKRFMQIMASRHPKEVQCLEDADVRKAAVESCRQSFKQGSRAMAWEAKLLSSDWNIPLQNLDASRLDVWYGKLDRNLSYAKATAAAEAWEGCKVHVLDEEAHLSLLVNHADEILRHLLAEI